MGGNQGLMAVPQHLRKESRLKYLYGVYQLEEEIVTLIANSSKKYSSVFRSVLIQDCDEALRSGRVANQLFPFYDKQIVIQRRYHLIKMIASVENIGTHVQLLIDGIRSADSLPESKRQKLSDRGQRIGEKCVEV